MNLFVLAAAACLTVSLPAAERALNCRYSLSPISAQHAADGGVYHLRLTVSHPQCQWSFKPSRWVHVNAKKSEHGSMDLMYELQPNFFEQPRVAKVLLEGNRPDGDAHPVATLVVRQQGRGQ